MRLEKESDEITIEFEASDGATSDTLFYSNGRIKGNKISWYALQIISDGKFRISRIIDHFGDTISNIKSKNFRSNFINSIKKTGTMNYVNRIYSNKDCNIIQQTSPDRIWLYIQYNWNSKKFNKLIFLNFEPDSNSTIDYLTQNDKHLYFRVIDSSSDWFIYYVNLKTSGSKTILNSPDFILPVTNNQTDLCAGDSYLYVMENGTLKLYNHGETTPTITYSSIITDTEVEMREIDDDDLFVRASGSTLYRITEGNVTTLSSALETDTEDYRINNKGTLYTEAVDITQTPNLSDSHKDQWFVVSENEEITAYLSGIINELCSRSGISEDDLDLSLITDNIVNGYVINEYNISDAFIKNMQTPFYFDYVESEGKLKFVQRGLDVSQTIQSNRLGAIISGTSIGNTYPENVARTIEASRMIPKTVRIVYLEALKDYNQTQQSITRQDVLSRDELSIDMSPFAFSDSVARQIAERVISLIATEKERFLIFVSAYYFNIEPTDVITLTIDGESVRVRVTQTNYTFPGILQVQGVLDDQEDYNSNVTGGAGENPGSDFVPDTETEVTILDINIISGGDDDIDGAGFYAGMRNLTTDQTWESAELLRRIQQDDGNWSNLGSHDSEVVKGQCITVLEDGTTDIIERKNILRLRLFNSSDSLNDITENEMINGSNLAIIGSEENGWEMILFTNAVQIESGNENIWEIDTFIRGYNGTEHLTDSHDNDDLFIYLPEGNSENLMNVIRLSITDIGDNFDYIAIGEELISEEDDELEIFTSNLKSNRHKAYSVVHETATKNPSTNDITITWIKRSRYDGEWNDLIDVPETEIDEAYEVDILSDETVIRTLSSNNTSVTYSDTLQNIDFGSDVSTLNCKIYKLNGDFGRGYEKELNETF